MTPRKDSSTFIISLDCEGKWGMADHISEYHRRTLTNENLLTTYRQLINLLDKWNIKATFAFVGAFLMDVEECRSNTDWFVDVLLNDSSWISAFKQDLASGASDGWCHPEAFEIVKQATHHEVASHGFTHLPLSESLISRSNFLHEMRSIKKLNSLKHQNIKTFVYPRNDIGYTPILKDFGIIGFRDKPYPSGRKFTKVFNLLRELNIRQSAQEHGRIDDGLVIIPSGYFLNWRYNLRKRIPLSITFRRWRHAIQDAIVNRRVVHLTTHPHNFIDGDQQFHLLERILQIVSAAVQKGDIVNLTQSEYCELLLSQNNKDP